MESNARLVSVNVGGVQTHQWKGRSVTTAIYKAPVEGAVRVGGVNVAGDAQADPRYHGGPEMAVYSYPSEHYDGWRQATPDSDFTWGAFGENLTTAGLLETDVMVGDRYRVGSVELVAIQPRMPCFKLQMRLGFDGALKHMIDHAQSGVYFSIAKEGEVAAGDAIRLVERPSHQVSIARIVQLDSWPDPDLDALRHAAQAPGLPTEWRERMQKRAQKRE